MNCVEVNEKMADLFDASISQELKDELLAHFSTCPDCKKSYEEFLQVVDALQPRTEIAAGNDFLRKVTGAVTHKDRRERPEKKQLLPVFTPVWKKVLAIAALVAIVFVLVPLFNRSGSMQNKAQAANTVLQNSIEALTKVKTLFMEFKVRTLEGDNFEYIGMHDNFIDHRIWKVFGDNPKWRIEKSGRCVVNDGKNQYMYMSEPGMALKGGVNAGFVGWMKILLDPGEILEKEKASAKENGAKYSVEEKGNSIILTVKAKAKGIYSNAYMLNTSIPESNNSRVYTFDKSTRLLKSLRVYVDSSGSDIQVLDLEKITYNDPVDEDRFTIRLPESLTWVPVKDIEMQSGVDAKTAGDAARMFFTACHKEDWATVRKLIPGFMNFIQLQFSVKAQYGGLEIISIGKPFKSGIYPGEFIPYEIKCKNGYVKKWNLAVRNDNPEKKWVLDGGY